MRLVLMSDTHTKHGELSVPDGDVLIHAGDATFRGESHEISEFGKWFSGQPHEHKIFVAGNHDLMFESDDFRARVLLGRGIKYLKDSGTTIGGVKFWGSPWQPRFFDWAFNLERGPELAAVWAKIPDDTEVLITHGPPFGIGDFVPRSQENVGCRDLTDRVAQLDRLRLHVFGHIHEGRGVWGKSVNAACLDGRYKKCGDPIVFDL